MQNDLKKELRLLLHDILGQLTVTNLSLDILKISNNMNDNQANLKRLEKSIQLSSQLSLKAMKLLHQDQPEFSDELTRFNFNERCEMVKELNQQSADKYGLDFSFTYTASDLDLYLYIGKEDADRFRENYFKNAAEANAQKVSIQYILRDEYVEVICEDDGDGMSQEVVDKINLGIFNSDNTIHGNGTKFIKGLEKKYPVALSYSSELGIGTKLRILYPIYQK